MISLAHEHASEPRRADRTDLTLEVEGMSCASCVSRVERALRAVPGVEQAAVNLASERAFVSFRKGAASEGALIGAIEKAGYHAKPAQSGGSAHHHEEKAGEDRRLLRDVILGAVLALPIIVFEMGSHLYPPLHHWLLEMIGTQAFRLAQFALATVILFGPGWRFFRIGVPALLRGAPEMNALVALGTGAAYGYSLVATFLPELLPASGNYVYYEAAVVIVVLILLGRLLEARAKGRTSQAVRRLVGLQAKTAHVLRDGKAIELAVESVVPGDLLLVRPGEKVPLDGEVVEGSSYLDESMISGEPIPVAKTLGSTVIGGTINKTGSFTFRATKVGADTMLAQIIRMVEEAQGSKLPIQALVDRVTGWFVPAVIAVAVATFALWLALGPEPALPHALVAAVAVLIIACPCAMGLATPTSIMVGTGRAAELGVLFRKGDALQALQTVTAIALDKTGTITEGRPALTDISVLGGESEDGILRLLAAVEGRSEHPIAEAIVAAASERKLEIPPVDRFDATPGFGVSAEVEGRRVELGADRFMAKLGYDIGALVDKAQALARDGKSPLFAALDGKAVAVLAIADPIKPTSAAAIDALHRLGIEVTMVTGDNRATAEAIGLKLKIDNVKAEVLPEGKITALRELRGAGRKVAFVGDGINDAPALAEADVGIAIGTGTDVAIESADVVLVGGDLRAVVNAIGLSRATLRNIAQNLFWAFAYNVVLIPVAAGLLYPFGGPLLSPMIGAGAMALSSVFVVTNALRLRGYRPTLGTSAAVQEQNS